ncbi:hypothetical protein L3Y34_010747 [Caenorhabditis briggsae]|uniref:Uncharacterized protein n=1 Tax=Caenorhabditis briggsae TaxID=6238 RepID=A0AAE9CTY3_CAEBR|nr:hypothetical protein L3Y34_010747 [Caenorhabditis briggsae]
MLMYFTESKCRVVGVGKGMRGCAESGRCGQDRYGVMTRVYYKDAHAAIIVLDSTRERTIEGALRWKTDLDQKVTLADGSPVPAILLANKCDIENQLGDDKLYDLETNNGFVGSFRTSAKESVGIEEAFKFLSNTVISTEQGGQYDVPFLNREGNVNLDDNSTLYKHDSKCC